MRKVDLMRRLPLVFLILLTSAAWGINAPVTMTFGPNPTDALTSDGSVYSADSGFGWDQDIRSQARKRADGTAGVALIDRSVTQATFTIDLPDGDYLFEVKAGDSEYTSGLAVMIDGEIASPPARISRGASATQVIPITSRRGKAQITFVGGQQGYPNSVINSIKITPASADRELWKRLSDASIAQRKAARESMIARAAKREKQRATYTPLRLKNLSTPRQTIDLTGKWLFMPAQDAKEPANPTAADSSWHVLGVPQFWQPSEWWIYTAVNGTSHNWIRKEVERCDAFTFDYANTNSGWYRQWIEVPKSLQGKRFVLKFDAVASIAQVYWNGRPVGSHVGMFGPFECEVTPNVRFGEKNLLAVMVGSSKTDPTFNNETVGVAVTVNITKDMLNSLPHGWYKVGLPGIWQPVSLEVMGKDRIRDLYWQPRLDGATVGTAVDRTSNDPIQIKHTIIDAATGGVLYQGTEEQIRGLKPKLWSPEHPNLYRLRTQLISNGKVVDERLDTVGFRTFEARGNRLYLNGKLYFLRGADMPPHGLEPNDKALADKFMKLMHDGNEMTTRFHMGPPAKVWLDAADKYGVGSSVGETWPWVLMGNNPIPDPKIMDAWKWEWQEVVRANRNHPSMLMWTISNESYFQSDPDLPRRLEKYRIFSDVIKAVRELSPDIPIVLHSGYVRDSAYFDQAMKPVGLDDGDIDDTHAYYGWYDKHPFRIDVANDIERRSKSNRPLISQEASTGYPDNDTGHPTESYMRDHFVPQAWVGKYGTYATHPGPFLDINAQITKDYVEVIRRERSFLSGWMIFANCCWFKDVYDADRITPYPVYWEAQKAWQPVLVSLALPDRHFEAGEKFQSEVVVCNDDPDRPKLTGLRATWRICGESSDMGTSGSLAIPDCVYDKKSSTQAEFTVPSDLPQERSDMTLELKLYQGDELISKNDYPIICAEKTWYSGKGTLDVVEADGKTLEYLKSLGFECQNVTNVYDQLISAGSVLVVGPNAPRPELVKFYVDAGARVLMLSPDAVPGIEAKKVNASGDFVDILEPRLLDGMNPMDMHWWNATAGDFPRVCRVSYQFADTPSVTRLAQHIQVHGYLRGGRDISSYTSWPVFEVQTGKGRLIVSSLLLADDPIAKRFTANLVNYLMR